MTAEARRNGSASTQVNFGSGSSDTVAEIVFGVGAALEVQLVSAGGTRMVGEWIDLREVGSSLQALTAQTSDIGEVVLPQVGCGSYALRADLPGIGGPLDGGRFEIVPGVETARSLAIRTATLSGHVARALDGAPVERASIALVVRIEDGDAYFRGTGSITETDEEGRFELTNIPIRPYRVEVTAEGVSTRITATPGGPPIELRL